MTSAPDGDARRLSEIERRGEDRDRGAARLRRHLRRFGLQRVVEHVEAEPDRRHGDRRQPPRRLECQHDISRGDNQEAADHGEAGLAEPVDQEPDQPGIDQPADAEARDGQTDEREAQAEAQMQICADIGERAPRQAPSMKPIDRR